MLQWGMDVRPLGGSSDPGSLAEIGGRTAPAAITGGLDRALGMLLPATADSVLLRELSDPDLAKLLELFDRDPPLAPQSGEQALAAAEHPLVPALNNNRESIVSALPVSMSTSAQALADGPLAHVAAISRMDAESRLALATRAIHDHNLQALPKWDSKPQALLEIGKKLLESGDSQNYRRAADVAQVIIDASLWLPRLPIPGFLESARGSRMRNSGFTSPGKQWSELRSLWASRPFVWILIALAFLLIWLATR